MVIQKWDPFRDFRRMEHAMTRLNRGTGVTPREGYNGWAVPLDVVQEADELTVKATIPGIKPEDIEVTLEDGILAIDGKTEAEHEEQRDHYLVRERRVGNFHRAIRLPDTVDLDKAETTYEHGVLTITFPKVEAKRAKKLEVKAA